jgi:hypothetical protein
VGILRWLFGENAISSQTPAYHAPEPTPRKRPRPPHRTQSRSFKLVEAEFDPDGNKTDLMWYGFHIHDENGAGINYDECSTFGLEVFRVAGVTHRPGNLQRDEFKPGEKLLLIAESTNPYDPNAVSVWDRSKTWQIGYVPKAQNVSIRARMRSDDFAALALAEHRKDGKRVSLTVLCGPFAARSGPAASPLTALDLSKTSR